MTASNIHYELADRTRATAHGGIGAMHLLVRTLGLDQAINEGLGLLKIHLPYHDSDHVLNIAYNLLAGGTCLEHLELLRNDEAYLDALGARRVPDPTTAGDFCRRFDATAIGRLQAIFNAIRLKVWRATARVVLRRGNYRGRRHDGRDHRRVQGRHGHQPQRPVGLSSAGPFAGQYGRAAVRRQSQRQSAQSRAGGLLF